MRMTYMEASRQALREEMIRDSLVWAVGEDLGRGGVFGQYKGLVEEFGPDRISDAPISEAAILGAAVGAAMMGTRPVVEMRFSDFALCAMDELVNQAAKARFMFGGQARVPLVVREPVGMWRSSAAQHSQSLEAWYAHVPGLVVACPATPACNKALLKAAIRCDDPVVFMEHKGLWPLEGDVPDGEDALLPFGQARHVREGGDVTIVSWSATAHEAERAAAAESIRTDVAHTGHVLVAHEAVQGAGFGAEVAATVAEQTGARVRRLGAPRALIGYAPTVEDAVRVTATGIADAAADLIRGRSAVTA